VNRYYPSASDKDLLLMAGLDSKSIASAVLDEVGSEISGGEDALVTALYELQSHSKSSRFQDTALPYLQKLAADTAYLNALRSAWAKRALPAERLPKSTELQKRLREATPG
jgi:hypothetical protein